MSTRRVRPLVPTAILKLSVDYRTKVEIINRIEARWDAFYRRLRATQEMLQIHRDYLDSLQIRTGVDHRQDFMDFYLDWKRKQK